MEAAGVKNLQILSISFVHEVQLTSDSKTLLLLNNLTLLFSLCVYLTPNIASILFCQCNYANIPSVGSKKIYFFLLFCTSSIWLSTVSGSPVSPPWHEHLMERKLSVEVLLDDVQPLGVASLAVQLLVGTGRGGVKGLDQIQPWRNFLQRWEKKVCSACTVLC